ncbi:MAG: YiiX/YebB-like N1pC/P60 family cysteine hydrolase [Lentilitoribacter sp.]
MKTGDLIFSFIGARENAISDVTKGFRGARVNHIGVLIDTRQGTFVLEAFPPEVRLTKWEVFSRRSNDLAGQPRIMVGRLHHQYHELIDSAIAYGIRQRDIPYDRLYLTDEQSLYCSELIVDMFRHANSGEVFFSETPMSFRDNVTGEIHPTWVQYYAYFGMSVPEGEPGSNPGEISLDSKIDIIDVIGDIPGYE